jgi:hypothetical protein
MEAQQLENVQVLQMVFLFLENSILNSHRQYEQNEHVHQMKNNSVVAVELQKSIIFQHV